MCYGCWQEYGSPKLSNERIDRAATLVDELYEFSCVGGNCHIVTDDWNLEDSHVAYCIKQVEAGGWSEPGFKDPDPPEQLAIETELLGLLKAMSMEERASVLAKAREYSFG